MVRFKVSEKVATHTWVKLLVTVRLDSKTTIRSFLGKRIKYKLIDSEGLKSKEFIRKGKDIINGSVL